MAKRLVPVVMILGWLIPGAAMALGLGPITMRSALNQPLLAEIDIHSVQPGDLDSLAVRLASDEDFQRVNVERPSYLNHINFKVVTRADGSAFVRLTTTKAITEPYLDFLVEARWARGRALKEYTVLVDPPVLAAEAPAPVEQPATAPVFAPPPQQQAQQQAQRQPAPAPKPRAQQPKPRPQPQAAPRPAPKQFTAPAPTGSMDYGMVKRGDTLWEIAETLRQRSGSDATVHQIMMALLRANPNAFINGNVNQLKAGYVLRMENPDMVADVSQTEALQEFRRQYREWRSGTGRLVQQVEVASGDVEAGAPAGTTSRPSKAEQAKLKLVAPGREGQGSGSASKDSTETQQLREDLILATEALDASRQESDELQTRLSELDEQLESMQRLITLKDEELLAVQNQLNKQSEDTKAVPPAKPEQPEQTAAQETGESSSFFLSDYLIIGVALLALIGVVAWLVIRRRKMQEGFEESILNVGMGASAAAAAAAMTAQAAGSSGGESSSMVSDFAMSDMAGIQSDAAEVDPISEADVYLAYGRHQQAEDIIKQAMETNPERLELQTKLLEVYHAANNRGAFEEQAQSLHDAIGGDESNEHWQRIVGLGGELCPDNPLFGGSMAAGEADLGFDNAMSDVTAEEEDLLDFDFNEDEISDLESASANTAADDTGLDFDVNSLDFNLDEEEPKTAQAAAGGDNSMDFDMSMDEQGSFDEDSTELNLSLDSGSDVDLGSIDFETETGIAEAPTQAMDDNQLSLASEVPTEAMERPADMGLSLDDFDSEETLHANSEDTALDLDASPNYGGGSELSLEDLGEDEELSDDIFADVDEIGTKLDLAKAYVDMGDSDGARSILDEVMEEGDDTQKEQAQELLRQIG
jgi:pilus assembly protein FimV